MHIHKSRFLVRGEVWYDGEPDDAPVDWIFYRQRGRPVPGAGWQFFYTLLLDLRPSPEALQQQLHNSTAYKIRRARDKDRVVCEGLKHVNKEMLDRFEITYNRFAAIKGLTPLDRQFLDQLSKDASLELSLAKDSGGKPLAYHIYYHSSERSCLLHAASLYQLLSDSAARNAMGRANRYLFWCDILRHKEQGLKSFDFGGWYPGKTDRERLEINRFKEGYGGRIVREYNCEQILSLKGWVLLTTALLLNRVKRLSANLQAGQRPPRPRSAAVGAEAPSAKRSAGLDSPSTEEAELAR